MSVEADENHIKIYSSSGKSYLEKKRWQVIVNIEHELGKCHSEKHSFLSIKTSDDLIARYNENNDSAMNEINEITDILDGAENLYINEYSFNPDHYLGYKTLDDPIDIRYTSYPNSDNFGDLELREDVGDGKSFLYTKDKELYCNGELIDKPGISDIFVDLIYAIIQNGIGCYEGKESDNDDINYYLRKIFLYDELFQLFMNQIINEFLNKRDRERLPDKRFMTTKACR